MTNSPKTPTPEQDACVAAFQTERDLVIQAGAGTGKTSTLELCARTTTDRGAYVAYNRAIADDAGRRFPGSVTCKTGHGFAYGAVGKDYRHRLNGGRIPARRVAQLLGIVEILHLQTEAGPVHLTPEKLARLVTGAVGRFCYSDEPEPRAWHVPELVGVEGDAKRDLASVVLPLAKRAWADVERHDGVLPFTHDCYLKLWQLRGPRIACDYLLLDEAQDANPVMAAIVRAQEHAQIVLVGDSCQQIYAWRGARDVMSDWPGSPEVCQLSRSFRFGPAVAAEANKWLGVLGAQLTLTGHDPIPSRVCEPGEGSPDAILCRSNAKAVTECMDAIKAGTKVALVGGGGQIRALAEAAEQLKAGRGCAHPDLMAFDTWGALQDYVEHDEGGSDLRTFVRMVDKMGADVLLAACDELVSEDAADLTVSTAHKAKGREWDHVRIAGDFQEPAEDGEGPSRPDAMLAYVSVTRAKLVLDRGGLEWIDDWYPTRRKAAPAQAELALAGEG
jgi:hypothetical protein